MFISCVTLKEGLKSDLEKSISEIVLPMTSDLVETLENNTQIWKEYWNKSGVKLRDEFLEQIWYHNLYFLNCATKENATTPGLFANWSFNNIGTAWHGDYHMNYNTQQPFWLPFSSNHLEKSCHMLN